jgi:membrane protease YdiL (CAAX protease family)
MVFRGWLLNSALDKNNDKNNQLQIMFNAVLFLVIHFPVWIRNNLFVDYIISGSFIQIMLLSIIFSWSFIKSKNIIVPVVLHMYWDFLCFLL